MKTQDQTNSRGITLHTLKPITIAAVLVLGLLPAVVQAQYKYTTNADNTITITKYTGPDGAVAIPDTIDGLSVTGIGDSAFRECTNVTSVIIPNSVSAIWEGAFELCFSLTSVTIGTNVTIISDYAFFDCEGLDGVTIPNSVTTIGGYAFVGCSGLTSVTIPNSVTDIGGYAFDGCFNLTNVTIDNRVTSIGVTTIEDGAFSDCAKLSGVYFEGNAPLLWSSVFSGDTNATVYYLAGTTGWDQWVSPPRGRF